MNDYVIEFMREHNIPLTRQNYLDVAYLGQVPEEIGGEIEAEIERVFARLDAEWLQLLGVEPLEEE